MNKLTKMVNIFPSMPITTINPPIRTTVKRVTKSVDEIRACLMARAIVEEVLPDGKTTRLNLGNYDKFESQDETCNCDGECTCGWKIDVVSTINKDAENGKTLWQTEYEKALNSVDLNALTRKQRRSAIAAARAAADEAVKNASSDDNTEVVMGVGTVETINDETVEPINDEPVVVEDDVQTLDVEKIDDNNVEDTSDETEKTSEDANE